jgi:hypothetical protein
LKALMKIRIKTTMNVPEIPPDVEIAGGTLREVFVGILANTRFVKEFIDPRTGDLSFDDLLGVRLNDVLYYALPEGMDTQLRDGDTITLSLILLGGG